MTGYTALLILCIVLRALFVASLLGRAGVWRMVGVGLAWASADIAIVLLSQQIAWTAAARAFVTLLAIGTL